MLSHHNLVANLCQLQPVLVQGEDDIVVAVLPFFHLYGQMVLMAAALWQGATLVTMPRFDLEQFLAVLQDYRVSRAFVVPPIVLALAKHPLVDRFDLSALRFINSAAAPLSAELEQACTKRLDCVVGQGYGLTETSPALTVHPPVEARIRHGSTGQLVPNTEAKVIDLTTGQPLGRNQDGELCFRGPQVMVGYLHAPRRPPRWSTPTGGCILGGIGHVDDDGYVYVVDRVKELIKYKGLQVAPAELEAVLLSHPQITDAAVVRVPDEAAGEVPKAFVVATAELHRHRGHGLGGPAGGAPQEGPCRRVHRPDPQVTVGQDPAAPPHGPRPAADRQPAELTLRSGRTGEPTPEHLTWPPDGLDRPGRTGSSS
jgi:acyl-CoA synthetase (AMP-forming)/AMP-acid ligase II